MSRLPSKWLNSLLGDDVSLAVYLSSDAMMVMRAQQQQGLIKHLAACHVAGKGWAQPPFSLGRAGSGRHQCLIRCHWPTVALASEHFDSYVLSFQETTQWQGGAAERWFCGH